MPHNTKHFITPNKKYKIFVGATGSFTTHAAKRGICSAGLKCKIFEISWGDSGHHRVAIQAEQPSENFHSLEGKLDDHTGYWLEFDEIEQYLNIHPMNYCVNKDFSFRNTPLKGKKCKVLGTLSDTELMVEFEYNIKGTSGDGLGKKGHCIPIPISVLEEVSVKEKMSNGDRG